MSAEHDHFGEGELTAETDIAQQVHDGDDLSEVVGQQTALHSLQNHLKIKSDDTQGNSTLINAINYKNIQLKLKHLGISHMINSMRKR